MGRFAQFARWTARHPMLFDTLAAFALAGFSLLTVQATNTSGVLVTPSKTTLILWSIALSAPVVIRRRFPQTAALAFVAIALLQLIAGPSLTAADLNAQWLLYSVIAYGDPANTGLFVIIALAMALITTAANVVAGIGGKVYGIGMQTTLSRSCSAILTQGADAECLRDMGEFSMQIGLVIVLVLLSVIVMGYWRRARLYTLRLMRERNASLTARQHDEARLAAMAERARIAREMHDVVAHTLSIVIIQSDAGRYAGADDPAIAMRTMRTIRDESVHALHGMRRLLGILDASHPVGSPSSTAPQIADAAAGDFPSSARSCAPSLQQGGGRQHGDDEEVIRHGYHDLPDLIEQARQADPSLHLQRTVEGTPEPDELGAKADLAIYRAVQEGLTNIRKHAGRGVHADIRETWNASGLQLRIENDGRGACATADRHQSGYGLVGMHERITALSGTVHAGPRPTGGFLVDITVPFPAHEQAERHADDLSDASADVREGGTRGPATAERTAERSTGDGTRGTAYAPPRALSTAWTSARTAGTPSAWVPALGASLGSLWRSMRSKPVATGFKAARRSNVIERLSHWFEHHYVMVDVVSTLLLLAFVLSTGFGFTPVFAVESWNVPGGGQPYGLDLVLINLAVVLPLAVRRRFPQASAAIVAGACAIQLIAAPGIVYSNGLVLISLYSVILYGPSTATRWVSAAVVGDSILYGLRAAWLSSDGGLMGLALMAMWQALMVMVLCAGTMAAALWTRSRGDNALVLQEREEALRMQQQRRREVAANLERNRIGAMIQQEVTATLIGVAERAEAGLRMLDDAQAGGSAPDPRSVAQAFDRIGERGREALKRLRKLLGILRQSGGQDAPPLSPVSTAGASTVEVTRAQP